MVVVVVAVAAVVVEVEVEEGKPWLGELSVK